MDRYHTQGTVQPTDESIRILHVDDDPDFGEVAARHLERIDDALNVGTVTSAAAGLDGSPFESALRTAMETGETGTLEAFYPPHDTRYDVSIYPAPDGISIYFRAVDGRREHSA